MEINSLNTKPLEEWWTRTLAGDTAAFRLIHLELFDGLFQYAARLLQDNELAGDVIQELFVKVWVRRESIGQLNKVKSYFFTALRRQVLNQLRNLHLRELKISALSGPDIEFSPEEIVVRGEEEETLRTKIAILLNELPARQKEAIYLHYFEGMDYTQIAGIMGINYQSVLNLTQKALQRLRSANLITLFIALVALYHER